MPTAKRPWRAISILPLLGLAHATSAHASSWTYEAGNGVCALHAVTGTQTDIRLMVSADEPEGMVILVTNPAWRLDKPKDFQVALTFHKVSPEAGIQKIRATLPAHVGTDGRRVIISIRTYFAEFAELSYDALRMSIDDASGNLLPEIPFAYFGEVNQLRQCANPRRF
ncbi:hypothetical protein [Novosphingobium sp.]|uniref:hypothetical protein n=1 Tax=Novosphingobium sp. TaxID=1874826 RepID=UPI0026124E90|nr:hypothetical protein [Novosphingobium sp.]